MADGFCSDMARTFVLGDPDLAISSRYDAIVRGLQHGLAMIRPGVLAHQLFDAMTNVVRQAGIPHYRRHHCGHGLGIGGYEQPLIAAGAKTPFRPGMILCLETPYYELGWGGMMVEDTILVTENGYDSISTLPHRLIVC